MLIDLGRLKLLLENAVGELERDTGVEIVPLFETTNVFIGGTENPPFVYYVSGWEVRFTSSKGSFAYRGASIADAVEDALKDGQTWR